MRRTELSDNDRYTLLNAIRVAAGEYDACARRDPSLGPTFRRQAREAYEWAERLEAAHAVVLVEEKV
jgi:hypothetical protein